jgi:hypothetical protein
MASRGAILLGLLLFLGASGPTAALAGGASVLSGRGDLSAVPWTLQTELPSLWGEYVWIESRLLIEKGGAGRRIEDRAVIPFEWILNGKRLTVLEKNGTKRVYVWRGSTLTSVMDASVVYRKIR